MAGGDEAAAWIALRAASGVGDVTGRKLVAEFGSPAAVPTLSRRAISAARREADRIVAGGARLIALDDAEYPELLRELHDAPLYLIAKGARLADGPAVAIVGARRATPYGLEIARVLAEGLAHAGVAVVSGLARGIDGAAHEGALAARGATAAVLGCGVDVVYPPEHRELAARVAEQGTLLSERPMGTQPLPSHFPARNRILAGMTQGTVVVEAAERSGSLITARLANESGREVFAVPGRIDSPLSFGAHLLIRDGATLVRDVDDVLEQIAPALRARAAMRPGAKPTEAGDAEILDALNGGPASLDDLIRQIGRPASEIIAMMLDLELRGLVRQLSGRQFQLTGRFAGVGGFQ
ncbi:MAG: DNA-processing protein DprA [Candidatus Binatia bacterium]